jgi:DNA-binding response OmpR family regulator
MRPARRALMQIRQICVGTAVAWSPSIVLTSIPPPPKKRILVVEDEPTAGNMLVRLLADEYEVELAGDGVEGLRRALTTPGPDLIITDVTMPGLDGVTMVERIRATTPRKAPVIFLTARGAAHDVVRGIHAGARHYMVKPVDIAELEKRIHRALGMAVAPSK